MFSLGFTGRSGRVISLSRLVLSAIFLVAIWLDPSQPSAFPDFGYVILAGYVAWSFLVLALTWSDWRRDWALAWPSHIVDIAVFAVMVFMTEGYTSPFFTQFVFLLLSAAIRWTWRETAFTAALVILAFFGGGLASQTVGNGEFELQRLVFRGSYLLVLSLLLIWFDLHAQALRRGPAAPEADDGRADERTGDGEAPPALQDELARVAAAAGATEAVLVWWDDEEPWLYSGQLVGSAYRYTRHDPGELDDLISTEAAVDSLLLDRQGALALHDGRRRTVKRGSPLDPRILQRFGLESCVAAPFAAEEVSGWVLLAGIPGLGVDDLALARRAADALEQHFVRAARERTLEQKASAESRLALARDLHDSVIQILAGTAFGLESMRRVAGDGPQVEAQIDRLRDELGAEQRELRGMIGRLRGGTRSTGRADLRGTLDHAARRIARQWNVECLLEACPADLLVPERLSQEIALLVREAAANAVKHGEARHIAVAVTRGNGILSLVVEEDGKGFAPDLIDPATGEVAALPASLAERVQLLGGQLRIKLLKTGVRVEIGLPTGVWA